MAHDDTVLYRQWMELLDWMEEYAADRNLTFDKVSDFPDYIYRMERPYDLPTTIASVAIVNGTQPLLLAAVSPRHVQLKNVSLRLFGASKHWHLHAGDTNLLEGKRPFTKERLYSIVDGALHGAPA